MTGVAVTPLLLFSAALYFSYAVEGYPRICAFNRANAVNNEKKCKYGWEMDPCGTKLCTKGNMNIPARTTLQMFAGIYGESTFRTCKNDRETLYRGKPQ